MLKPRTKALLKHSKRFRYAAKSNFAHAGDFSGDKWAKTKKLARQSYWKVKKEQGKDAAKKVYQNTVDHSIKKYNQRRKNSLGGHLMPKI